MSNTRRKEAKRIARSIEEGKIRKYLCGLVLNISNYWECPDEIRKYLNNPEDKNRYKAIELLSRINGEVDPVTERILCATRFATTYDITPHTWNIISDTANVVAYHVATNSELESLEEKSDLFTKVRNNCKETFFRELVRISNDA